MADHTLLGGKLHVHRRDNSRFWQCSTCVARKNRRVSTHEESLAAAKDFAKDWYLGLKGKLRRGEVRNEKTFRDAAKGERPVRVLWLERRGAGYAAAAA